MLTSSISYQCAISIPIRGRLSFPKMVLSCPVVTKNGVSSAIHPLDCSETTIFPMMLIVSLVKPQYNSRNFLSTGRIFNCGFLNLSSCRTFC